MGAKNSKWTLIYQKLLLLILEMIYLLALIIYYAHVTFIIIQLLHHTLLLKQSDVPVFDKPECTLLTALSCRSAFVPQLGKLHYLPTSQSQLSITDRRGWAFPGDNIKMCWYEPGY